MSIVSAGELVNIFSIIKSNISLEKDLVVKSEFDMSIVSSFNLQVLAGNDVLFELWFNLLLLLSSVFWDWFWWELSSSDLADNSFICTILWSECNVPVKFVLYLISYNFNGIVSLYHILE